MTTNTAQTSPTAALAQAHRSIRQYKPTPIPDGVLETVLKAGLRASSAGNMQSWSVIVTGDPAVKRELYALHYEQEMILQAPLVFTFCADFHRMRRWVDLSGAVQSFDDICGFLTGAVDAVIAAQTMALAAESLGLGICYMGTTLWAMDGIGRALGIPRHAAAVTSFVIGYPDEDPVPKDRLPLSSIVHREKYEARTDADILAEYAERERNFAERLASNAELRGRMEKHGLKNLASMYTGPFKYSKEQFTRASDMIRSYLASQGLW